MSGLEPRWAHQPPLALTSDRGEKVLIPGVHVPYRLDESYSKELIHPYSIRSLLTLSQHRLLYGGRPWIRVPGCVVGLGVG